MPVLNVSWGRLSRAVLPLGLLLLTVLVSTTGPAQAAGRVVVDHEGQGAVIDSRYSTELSVSGRGFQSVKGGHGGLYVWFGTVGRGWQPSKGGKSGSDYVYVPDSETKGNAGFQRYVAFPGSDTASAANGGTMSGDGGWSVRLLVPGPTFQGVGRDGTVRTVDCRKVTCGIITVGAHGVHNANNETFTPVRVTDLTGSAAPQDGQQPATGTMDEQQPGPSGAVGQRPGGAAQQADPRAAGPGAGAAGPVAAARRGKVALKVDRASAVSGRALSFVARGLTPGEQFTVVLDDGLAASGPHTVGADGRSTGVVGLPADLAGGTHELRLFGASRDASVMFGVAASSTASAGAVETDETSAAPGGGWWSEDVAATLFLGVSALVFVAALLVVLRRALRSRRAHA